MDESLRHDNPNPTLTANPLSLLSFWWLNPLFSKGYKRRLEESDMFDVCPADSSKHTGETLHGIWRKELERQKNGNRANLSRALLRAYGSQYMFLGIIALIQSLIKIGQPMLMAEFLDYFADGTSTSSRDAWFYATGVVLCAVLLALTHNPFFFGTDRVGMRIRVALCSLMYRKCLQLSNESLSESSVGQIVNLMSNDVARFDRGFMFFHFLWVGPVQALVAVIYLWYRLGPAITAALAVMVLLIPIQILIARLFSRLRRKTAAHTDKRVKVMNEIISGIRIIKLYCWEKPFDRLVENLRRLEVRQLRRTRRVQACVMGPYFAMPQLAIFMFVLVLVLTEQEYDVRPGNVFMVMGVVQSLRLTCGFFVPMASQNLAECLVVIGRIQRFLLLGEQQKGTNQDPAQELIEKGISHGHDRRGSGVEVSHLTAKWKGSSCKSNTLEDISISVRPGRLVAVIGPVGSGKTSLLMSILGELPVQLGSVSVHGKIAYVSQHPWIFSGSLRQNILLGESFDKARYDKIIRISALSRDLSLLPNGDVTLIGDRGVTLSGGQRARVSLARALYMDADIYLLDDPLAAVDTTVGRHIFDKCIMKYLKEKTRILVTHQIQLLPEADNILILSDGQVVNQGTYSELFKTGVDFSLLFKSSLEVKQATKNQNNQIRFESTDGNIVLSESKCLRTDSLTSKDSVSLDIVPDSVQLPEEEKETGNIDSQVFITYIKSGAGILSIVVTILFWLMAQVLLAGSDWWLARWTNQNEDRHSALKASSQSLFDHTMINGTTMSSLLNTSELDIPDLDTHFNLYVYAGIICVMFACCLTRALLFFMFAVSAGEKLHNLMFARCLRATMAFFDTNPAGRVLNRFSKDMGQIDDLMPWFIFDFLQSGLATLGIVIVSSVINPWVLILVIPLAVLILMLLRYYVKTSRSVKRLEGTTRSPVFSQVSSTIQGLHTIRAMQVEQRFQAEFDTHQDLHSQAWFLFLSTSRWLGIRLDCLSVVFVACVVYGSMLAADTMDAGFVGLSVVYSLSFMGMFQRSARQYAELEEQMVSVERVLQYIRLPIEVDLDSNPGEKAPDTWPSCGSLQARGVSLQYSPCQPAVLKDLHFNIQGGEKIGIVGRTGAGKSSLITLLFRLAEPEGELTIDGLSIQSLGLHDLRKVISIIPQDPVLFTGSVRRNLDPFDEYSDSQLWGALDEVQLKEAIMAHPDNLYMEVSEGGTNFSAGQRQLMCLARAVLGNTRILVIDEATANVDPITDGLIQQTIRSKFQACTVLTIAHRLHTIIDSDRIMVLDAGRIVEMDTPSELLSRGHGSLFYSMVEQLGKVELDHLTKLAANTTLKHSSKTPSELINDGYHQTNAATPQTSETGMLGLTSINGRTDLRTFDAQRPECFQNEVTRL